MPSLGTIPANPTVTDLAKTINATPPDLNAIVQYGIQAPALFEQLGPQTKQRLASLMQNPVPPLPPKPGEPAGKPSVSLLLEQYLAQTPAGPYLAAAKMILPGTFQSFEKKIDSLSDKYLGWLDTKIEAAGDYMDDFFSNNPVGQAIIAYIFPVAGAVNYLINLFDDSADNAIKDGLQKSLAAYSAALAPLGLRIPMDDTWRIDGDDYGEAKMVSCDLYAGINFPLSSLPTLNGGNRINLGYGQSMPNPFFAWQWGDKGLKPSKPAWLIAGNWYRVWPVIGKIEARGPTRTGNY